MKISLKSSRSKQAEEGVFFQKTKNGFHLSFYYDNHLVRRSLGHKHLGLDFYGIDKIINKINKTLNGFAFLRKLRMFLSLLSSFTI